MEDVPEGLISVICPNHRDLLVGGLLRSFKNHHRVDLNFQLSSGQKIGAHEIILELFLSLEKLSLIAGRNRRTDNLQGNLKVEDTDENDLKVKNYDSSATYNTTIDSLPLLLEFVYSGRLAVQREQLDRLVVLAKELDFKILIDAAESLVESDTRQVTAAEPNCVQTRQSSRRLLKRKSAKRKLSQEQDSDSVGDESDDECVRLSNKRSQTANTKSKPAIDNDADESSDYSDGRGSSQDPEEMPVKPETESDALQSGNAKKARDRGRRSGTRGRQLHKCKFCDYQTGIRATFQIHLSKHDPTMLVFKCRDCSRKFLTEASLERHKLKHAGGPEIYECPHCDYKIRTKTRYKIHLAKHDPTVAVFRCGTCGRQVFNEEALQRHMRKHKIYRCGHCEFETLKRWSYDHHLFAKHQVNCRGEPVTKLLCDQDGCTYSCKTESELKYHTVAKHSGDRPHKCDQCNFSSGRKGDVGKHVKAVHLNLKPHLCESCGYRTVSQSALEQHKRTHTGQKVFKCDVCDKSYGDHSTLRRHKQVAHGSDGKPYVCHVCANSYNRRDHLRIHLTRAHDLTAANIGSI